MLPVFRRTFAALHRWAESGWSGHAVGTWSFLQGSVVPGPSDALLAPLAIADPPRAYRLAVWATVGAVLGGCAAYLIGAMAFDSLGLRILDWMGVTRAAVEARRGTFERHGWSLVALSAISPLPTKIVCLAAGAFGVPVWAFGAALFVGRGARFGVVAALCRAAGARIEDEVEAEVAKEEAEEVAERRADEQGEG